MADIQAHIMMIHYLPIYHYTLKHFNLKVDPYTSKKIKIILLIINETVMHTWCSRWINLVCPFSFVCLSQSLLQKRIGQVSLSVTLDFYIKLSLCSWVLPRQHQESSRELKCKWLHKKQWKYVDNGFYWLRVVSKYISR